jgi:hypothetical protein
MIEAKPSLRWIVRDVRREFTAHMSCRRSKTWKCIAKMKEMGRTSERNPKQSQDSENFEG